MKTKLIIALICVCLFSIYTRESVAQTRRGRAPRKSPPAITKTSPPAITTPSGLTYVVTKAGTGAQLKAGDTVILHYTGMLTNGVKFDSSHDRNEPFSFKLGEGRVIKGYDEGLSKLRVGDHAILVIPSKIAYGPKGVPNVIPPDSTLIFVIEVVGIDSTSQSQ